MGGTVGGRLWGEGRLFMRLLVGMGGVRGVGRGVEVSFGNADMGSGVVLTVGRTAVVVGGTGAVSGWLPAILSTAGGGSSNRDSSASDVRSAAFSTELLVLEDRIHRIDDAVV